MTDLDELFTQAEQDEIRQKIDSLLAYVTRAHNADVPRCGRKVMCDGSADNPSSGNLP